MSKRTETYTVTQLFCDEKVGEELCPNPTDGPCALCRKDLCKSHTGSQRLVLASWTVFLCSECVDTTSVKQLQAIDFNQLYDEFYQRQRE